MKLRLGEFLLIFGILATASGEIVKREIDIFRIVINIADSVCHDKGPQKKAKLSSSQGKVNVLFELRTPCNRAKYPVSEANKLRDSPDFDPNKRTVLFVSGWDTKINEPYTEKLTKAYHCRGGHNFIVVDTLDFITGGYIPSAAYTEWLGESVAKGLQKLNITGENIHLIGHSLGAHIMGSAGHNFEKLTGQKIGRITGLDPARPCFSKSGEKGPVFKRLGVENATFVDIIHSNSKQAGTEEAIGHADFYPGGLNPQQPSCGKLNIKCSHNMSIKYYTESVFNGNDGNFMGDQCASVRSVRSMKCEGSKMKMGFAVDKNARGVYVLRVKKTAPYGEKADRSVGRKAVRCGICKNK